jgi:hypothetical protein
MCVVAGVPDRGVLAGVLLPPLLPLRREGAVIAGCCWGLIAVVLCWEEVVAFLPGVISLGFS